MKRDWRYAYEFYEKYTGKPKDWDRIAEEMRQLSDGASPLLSNLLLALYNTLEDESR